MQINVLLDIFFELLQKQKLTASYLAEKHGISARTVYRYVEKLSENVPLQIKRGRNGGVFLSECYKLPQNFLTAEEYACAQEAFSVAYEQFGDERFLQAKSKLFAQEKSERKNVLLTEEVGSFFIDCSGWDGLDAFTEKLRLFKTCIAERYTLAIEYLSPRNERVSLKIDPHALLFQKHAWQAYAFCHEKRTFRSFRLGKILCAVQTGERFVKRDFQEELIRAKTILTKTIDVRLEISKASLSAVQDWLGAERLRQQGEKWYADVTLPDDETLTGTLLAFGANVQVLAPKSLREKIVKETKKTMALYT